MSEEELQQMRDDVRCETTVRAIEDILWRFNEDHEDTVTVYDVIGLVMESLIKEGMCPACIAEAMDGAYDRAKADVNTHLNEDEESRPVAKRSEDDVFH